MNQREAAVAELERRVGYQFQNRELLERALTHSSVTDRQRSAKHNERLEFLGDRVLNLIIADELMRRLPDSPEGDLTKVFHTLINVNACAEIARQIGLGAALRMGGGAGKTGIRQNERVLGDACEALIAALYRDGGLPAATRFVLTQWEAQLSNLGAPTANPKGRLSEWALARGLPAPEYRVLSQVGPAHDPLFQIEVFVQGFEPTAAEGGSKKEAEQIGAERLLQRLEQSA